MPSFGQYMQWQALWWRHRLLHPKKHKQFQKHRRPAPDSDYSYAPFDQRQALFVHIPKCAGVSVSRALFGNLAGGHKSLAHYCDVFEPAVLRRFFKFTIVRNPWDRLLSAYVFLKQGGMDAADREWSARELADYDTFDRFVDGWLNADAIWRGVHFYPQSYFLDSGAYPVTLDFVGRFENLAEDFDTIGARMGVEVPLQRLNQSGQRLYRQHYSASARDKVAALYAQDIERLGYEF